MNDLSNSLQKPTASGPTRRGEGAALLGCGLGVAVLALLVVVVLVLLVERQPEVESFMLRQQRQMVLATVGEDRGEDRDRLIGAFDRAEAVLRRGGSDPIRMQELWTRLMEFSLRSREGRVDESDIDGLVRALDAVGGASPDRAEPDAGSLHV